MMREAPKAFLFGALKMKAIETKYKGYKFRSRLEARWAVFFDSIGIEWLYEPEGFEKEVNGELIRYLPDFYLPEKNIWVEVKGKLSECDADRLGSFLDFGCPMKDFTFETGKKQSGLLLLGDIPDVNQHLVLHPIIHHYKGLIQSYFCFTFDRTMSEDMASVVSMFASNQLYPCGESFHYDAYASPQHDSVVFFDSKPMIAKSVFSSKDLMDAYKAAREARFEF